MSIDDTNVEEGLNATVYADLRQRLITGRMSPGHELSTRSIAAELSVSQTPVRDALSRLAAEGAVSIRSKRRVRVPAMNHARFADLLHCRLLLEPEAAALALPHLGPQHVAQLRAINGKLDAAIAARDGDAYMQANHAFHFALYRAQPHQTLVQLIEALWLQLGPFMRVAYGAVAISTLNDDHSLAIQAVEKRDANALRAAIAHDISDGMGLIASAGLSAPGAS